MDNQRIDSFCERTNRVPIVIKEKIWKTWSYTKIGFLIRLCTKPILGSLIISSWLKVAHFDMNIIMLEVRWHMQNWKIFSLD